MNELQNKIITSQFLKFEGELLSNPDTMFTTFEAGYDAREAIIFQEYLQWQKYGGKTKKLQFKTYKGKGIYGTTILSWKINNERVMQSFDEDNEIISIDEYKNALSSVYSFLRDRPQYYKFRKFDGMFNPLQILLYKLISKD